MDRAACLLALIAIAFALPIDRKAVVARYPIHTIANNPSALDPRDVFTLGNGDFAFNVDATGFQSLNQTYITASPKYQLDLNTLSSWAFHSVPAQGADRNLPLEEFRWTTFQTATGAKTTRPITLATNDNLTGPYRDYTMTNPQRVGLGQLSLRGIIPGTSLGADPPALDRGPFSLTSFESDLDMWTGSFSASFVLAQTSDTDPICSAVSENQEAILNCPYAGSTITKILFASYGTPSGACPSYATSSCNSANSTAVVEALCLHHSSCAVRAGSRTFGGDPCLGVPKALAIVAVCSPPPVPIDSTFAISTQTVVSPDVDLVATRMSCTRTNGTNDCPVAIRLAFGYATGSWGPSPSDWNPGFDTVHTSTVTTNTSNHLTISRIMDDFLFTVDCEWDDKRWTFVRTGAHSFVLAPPPNATTITVELSCLWTPAQLLYPIGLNSSAFVQAKVAATRALLAAPAFPLVDEVLSAARQMWEDYWMTGAFVDLAGNANGDPAASELERRVVLSRYLVRAESAGSTPPQETGLLSNSWSGKFHLEMRWWHQSHFPFWGKQDLLDRANAFYFDLLENATSLAKFQGYAGARWQKMLGLANPTNRSAAIDVPWCVLIVGLVFFLLLLL